jgi:predicted amidohydrolase
MVAVALANYPGEGGRSMAFHPVMSAEVDGRPLDTLVVEAGSSEEIALAEFDLDAIRRYREAETWGNAYRKPRAYGALVSGEVRPPFVRPDSRR